ncbi:MAG: hypothetical protein IIC95_09575 [Chloroflexi bacterium]|nr:hypothetical protein [Chloroflexota bacterium]
MAKIEQFSGILQSVDTEKRELVLAVQVVPPEPETADRTFKYDLSGWSEDAFFERLGTRCYAKTVDSIIKEFSY